MRFDVSRRSSRCSAFSVVILLLIAACEPAPQRTRVDSTVAAESAGARDAADSSAEVDGVLIPDSAGGRFSLARFQTRHGTEIRLQRLAGREGTRAIWRDVASLRIPAPQPDERLILSDCRRGRELDFELIAIVRNEDAEELRDVRRAWRANRSTGSFQELSPAGIVCKNESYGI